MKALYLLLIAISASNIPETFNEWFFRVSTNYLQNNADDTEWIELDQFLFQSKPLAKFPHQNSAFVFIDFIANQKVTNTANYLEVCKKNPIKSSKISETLLHNFVRWKSLSDYELDPYFYNDLSFHFCEFNLEEFLKYSASLFPLVSDLNNFDLFFSTANYASAAITLALSNCTENTWIKENQQWEFLSLTPAWIQNIFLSKILGNGREPSNHAERNLVSELIFCQSVDKFNSSEFVSTQKALLQAILDTTFYTSIAEIIKSFVSQNWSDRVVQNRAAKRIKTE